MYHLRRHCHKKCFSVEIDLLSTEGEGLYIGEIASFKEHPPKI